MKKNTEKYAISHMSYKTMISLITGILIILNLDSCQSKEQKILKQHQEEAISRASLPPDYKNVFTSPAKTSS